LPEAVATTFWVADWVSLVRQGGTAKLDTLVGVSVTLAAHLLRVSRSRVHQLLKAANSPRWTCTTIVKWGLGTWLRLLRLLGVDARWGQGASVAGDSRL